MIADFLSTLLRELQQWYLQVALARLHKRVDGYHRHSGRDETHHTKSIRSSLLDYVDNVAVAKQQESPAVSQPIIAHPESAHVVDTTFGPPTDHFVYPLSFDKNKTESGSHKLDKDQISDLSRYFKARTQGSDLHDGIEKKLRRSIWDHINAAVQCALKGDRKNARMHVDIADSAFREVAHYMSEAGYQELSEKITARLDALKAGLK